MVITHWLEHFTINLKFTSNRIFYTCKEHVDRSIIPTDPPTDSADETDKSHTKDDTGKENKESGNVQKTDSRKAKLGRVLKLIKSIYHRRAAKLIAVSSVYLKPWIC